MKVDLNTFKEQMLDKYPNMDKITSCDICGHDLRYDNKIHRIHMKWYCNKCYKKYKEKTKMINTMSEIKETLDTCNVHQLSEIRRYVDMLGKQMNKGLESLFK